MSREEWEKGERRRHVLREERESEKKVREERESERKQNQTQFSLILQFIVSFLCHEKLEIAWQILLTSCTCCPVDWLVFGNSIITVCSSKDPNGELMVMIEFKKRKKKKDVFKLFFPLEKKAFNTVLFFFHRLVLFLSICLIYCNNFSKSVQ